MPVNPSLIAAGLSRRHARYAALLAGVSAMALFIANPQAAARSLGGVAPPALSAAAIAAAQSGAAEAARAARAASNSLKRATMAIQAQQASQQAARDAALQAMPSGLPHGLRPGGLQVAPGATPGSDLWQGASLPTEFNGGDRVKVTVEQNQQKAILTWQTFNVSERTDLRFDQKGNRDWIALNRVLDNTAPSRILGTIKADGQIYVINRNGIIFGGASQVNVGALIASSLHLFSPDVATSNNTFLTSGINNKTDFILGGNATFANATAFAEGRPGDINIAAGAEIVTGPGGFSVIAAPNVTNAGTILAQDGQAILAATYGLKLLSAFEIGSPLAGLQAFKPLAIGTVAVGGSSEQSRGTLINTGLVAASRGNVSLTGYEVRQDGIVQATTGVSRPGSLYVAAQDPLGGNGDSQNAAKGGVLTFSRNSLTMILPAFDGETTTTGAAADLVFRAPAATIAGAQVAFQDNALLLAPGATIELLGWGAITTPNVSKPTPRLEIGSGAVIDVSGLADVQRSVADNLITIPRVGQNELADSPLQRNGWLYRQSITIDGRRSGIRDDGLEWFGSPLLNARGYVENQPRTIDEMLVNGGSITVIGRELVTRPGSLVAVDGGFVHYLGGMVKTTRLLGANGRVYDIADADPNMTYIGIAGQFTRHHARWGITENWSSPLHRSGHYESDYIVGGRAGAINLMMSGPTVLGGALSGEAFSGRYQVSDGKPAEAGSFSFAIDSAVTWRSFDGSLGAPVGRDLIVVRGRITPPADFGFDDPATVLPGSNLHAADPGNPRYWTSLSADMLNEAGFANLKLGNGKRAVVIDTGAPLQVQDGGSITLSGARVEVNGNLTARSGDISISSTGTWGQGNPGAFNDAIPVPIDPETGWTLRGDIVIGAGVRLDASGRFVNDGPWGGGVQTGSAFIDGGSISLTTQQSTPNRAPGSADGINFDWTGSILLGEGTILDASGGGYVNADGTLAMRDGRPLGRGGDIALRTYVRDPGYGSLVSISPANQFAAQYAVVNGMVGRIVMDGAELRSFSMGGGGTLTLRALDIQIGGTPRSPDPRILRLAPDFFATQGFGVYDLSAEFDATIAAGATVHVIQRNLIPDGAIITAPTGTDLYSGAYGRIGTLDPYYRPATNFRLRAGDYIGRLTTGDPLPSILGATGTTLIDAGASLLLDAGAHVRLGSRNQVTVLGSIVAHGGEIILSGDTTADRGDSPIPAGEFPVGYTSSSKSVWLGADSLLDVSGISLLDAFAMPIRTEKGRSVPRTGRILGGGSVTLTNDSGYIVVEEGARIDISGAADRYDLRAPRTGLITPASLQQDVWSDAGTVSIATASGLYFDGTIAARGGSDLAAGGTLVLRPIDTTTNNTGTGGVLFHQGGSLLPGGLTPGAIVEAALAQPSGIMHFAAERLRGSGIDTLVAGTDPSRIASFTPFRIGFSGDVTLSLGRAILLNASSYVALAPNTTDLAPSGAGGAVNLIAPYVSMTGLRDRSSQTLATDLVTPDGGVLNVEAGHIDIGGRFNLNNFADATFVSTGHIRFFTKADYAYAAGANNTFVPAVGQLLTAGDVTFKAAQLYPATNNAFAVVALGPMVGGVRAETAITIEPNGVAATPLSAGGALLLDATHIEQKGTIRAPAGSIVLGVRDPSDADTKSLFGGLTLVATESVRLGAGSLTSVSLDGLLVPYGVTVDQLDYRDTSNPFLSGYPNLSAPPEKQILVNAANASLDSGATIDLSGGGDLYAIEWVPGTGGSRDVLSRINTRYSANSQSEVALYPDGRSVYAIVPGFAGIAAPYDPMLDTGDVHVGQSIYLSGGNGIPAGIYTLLPAKYATLPGAYRVVQNTGTVDTLARFNMTLPDGTQRVAGYFTDALTGARDARSTAFLVQSASVWRSYSQYEFTSASEYFTSQAAQNGTAIPQLPIDAGRLSLAATAGLNLGATLRTGAANGGAAAQVDIASARIQIVGGDALALNGYLQLSATDLNALGVGSLLIGGTRRQNGNGVTITAQASNLVVSNDADTALVGPEILLVSNGNASGGEAAGIRLEEGSVIRAQGHIPSTSSVPITIGRDANAETGVTAIGGDGALLRVSNGSPVLVVRNNITGDPLRGVLDIRAGATIDGGQSLSLDATGDTSLNPAATLIARAIDANSSRVSFVNDAASAAGLTGLVVGPASLAQLGRAESVTFRSRGIMTFVGAIDVALSDAVLTLSAGSFAGTGADVRLSASTLMLSNDLGAITPTASNSGGRLILAADRLQFGVGDKSLTGFAAVDGAATEAIIGVGRGSFDFGAAPVTFTAPAMVAGDIADTTLASTGAMRLVRSAGTGPADLPVGGSLTLVGGSLESDARLVARGGAINLRATTGDLALNAGSIADVSGVAKAFFDVTKYAAAGAIGLTADQGNVRLLAGAVLDFSGTEAGGDAGGLSVAATRGIAVLDGTIDGRAVTGYAGGSFSLATGGAVSLDGLAERLAATGIDRAIALRSLSGNLELTAGHVLRAQEVTLIADGGAGGRDSAEGRVIIGGVINASGTKGGTIALSGKSGVDVQGSLLATGSSAEERGGSVRFATIGLHDGNYNIDYGYQNVAASGSGSITIGANAVIDVSGGTAGGLSGGTLAIRAPLLNDGDVNVVINSGVQIRGAREVGLEAYAVWSTTDTTTGSQHFDGIVDPAGWFDSQGVRVAGTWTDRNNNTVANGNPERDFFKPTTPNADHVGFYQTTLANFVRNPGFAFEGRFAGITNFKAKPGIELSNPDPNINGGNISVLSNWNLGAGASPTDLIYRYSGEAPVLTLRSENDIRIAASVSDGFWFFGESLSPSLATQRPAAMAAAQAAGLITANGQFAANVNGSRFAVFLPGTFATGTPEQQSSYYDMYIAYIALFSTAQAQYGRNNNARFFDAARAANRFTFQTQAPAPTNPPPPVPTTLEAYPAYLTAYRAYAKEVLKDWAGNQSSAVPYLVAPSSPPLLLSSGVAGAPRSGNTPAPVATWPDQLPIHSAGLLGGGSSYRFVAGAAWNSSNPLALNARAAGDIVIEGRTIFTPPTLTTRDILLPTLLRTGTGSIDLVAGNDIRLDDARAPGAIYSAGRPSAGNSPAPASLSQGIGAVSTVSFAFITTGAVNPEAAGDVRLTAGRDVIGNRQVFDADGRVTSRAGTYVGQYWWQWMQLGNTANASTINFGAFDQGVMSIGGDVSIDAGRDIRELSVSLPTTWTLTPDLDGVRQLAVFGGGDLAVSAGRDVLGGDFFVSKGSGELDAGGRVGSAFTLSTTSQGSSGTFPASTSVATIFALQDADWQISGATGVEIGGIYNPSYVRRVTGLFSAADSQAYSPDSSLSVMSTSGNVALGTVRIPGTLFSYGASLGANGASAVGKAIFENVLPASISATAFDGDLSVEAGGALFPSANGDLTLLAADSLRLFSRRASEASGTSRLRMFDVDAAVALPSPTLQLGQGINPSAAQSLLGLADNRYFLLNLHRNDANPVRLYAVQGDIIGGYAGASGSTLNSLTVSAPKPALVQAGRDIVDFDFRGTNYRDSDVTRITAGRDLYYTRPNVSDSNSRLNYRSNPEMRLEIAGPGILDVQAGRNLGPLASEPRVNTGILSIGNRDNAGLPFEGADIRIRFGTGPGIATDAFALAYLDPAAPMNGLSDFSGDLLAFMRTYFKDHPAEASAYGNDLTADKAWSAFKQLPEYRRQVLVDQVFLKVLNQVGLDYNNVASPYFHQYARGYQAINTLFPAALGYTANALDGGAAGASDPITTGNLDMRGSTIQTQQGGDIDILAPGGQILVGSSAAPPVIVDGSGNVKVGPSQQGILTLRRGSIGIFADRSTLLAQSRIFTQQGGDILIWSSSGDINAGKGAKTSSEKAPIRYDCSPDRYCIDNAAGQVTGAGIATLQTIPDAPTGSATLVAPRGTVDAGDAGIRVSGDLNVAALRVLNADNISAQGKATGVPTIQAPNVAGLTEASNVAGAAAQQAATPQQGSGNAQPSIIIVEVLGFGGGDGESKRPDENRRRDDRGTQLNGDSERTVRVLGSGSVTQDQLRGLTDEEKMLLLSGERRRP